jgi:hypothetical protein
VRDLLDIKVFVDTPDDLRLLRRIRRDTAERGRSLESVLKQYEDTVRPSHLEWCEPTKIHADVIIPRGGEKHGRGRSRAVSTHVAIPRVSRPPLLLVDVVGLVPSMIGASTPNLKRLVDAGGMARLPCPFPAVTCTSQATLLRERFRATTASSRTAGIFASSAKRGFGGSRTISFSPKTSIRLPPTPRFAALRVARLPFATVRDGRRGQRSRRRVRGAEAQQATAGTGQGRRATPPASQRGASDSASTPRSSRARARPRRREEAEGGSREESRHELETAPKIDRDRACPARNANG